MEYKVQGVLMKKSLLCIGILALCIASVSRDIQHEAVAINIQVPVRVFDGETFIENLTKEDFEVRENGVVQVIEALYLIKKDRISREESDPGAAAGQAIAPEISRYFLLMFELSDWLPRLNEALEYFFDQVLLPRDSLAVVTPAQTYHFKQEAWTRLPKEKIFQQLKEKLRQDIMTGNIQYKSALKGIERLFTFDVPQDLKQIMYMDQVRFLQQLKVVDEKRMESLAEHLKGIPGQKHVFMFYQNEVLPVLPGLEDVMTAKQGGVVTSVDNSQIVVEYHDVAVKSSPDIGFDDLDARHYFHYGSAHSIRETGRCQKLYLRSCIHRLPHLDSVASHCLARRDERHALRSPIEQGRACGEHRCEH